MMVSLQKIWSLTSDNDGVKAILVKFLKGNHTKMNKMSIIRNILHLTLFIIHFLI